MKNKPLISIINILGASATSSFLFIADYWEPFQGVLQDPIFYMSFVLPGLFFSLSLILILPSPSKKQGKLFYLFAVAGSWTIIYTISMQLFVQNVISTRELPFVLMIFGALGAYLISCLTSYFYGLSFHHLYAAITGLIAVIATHYVIVPLTCSLLTISLYDLQASGIIVFFWQLSLGLLFWFRHQRLQVSLN